MNNFYGFQPYNPYVPNNYMAMSGAMSNNNLQISYVNGLTGAKGYSLPPNTTIFLMDSDAPQFYIKTSDRNGMCTIKSYRFEELQENGGADTQKIDMSMYATKEELNNMVANLLEKIQKDIASVQSNKGGLL